MRTCTKFKLLFNKYSICHNLMNSGEVFHDAKIKELGKFSHICLQKYFKKNIYINILQYFDIVEGEYNS